MRVATWTPAWVTAMGRPPARLGVLHAGEHRAVLGEQGPAELGDQAVAPVEQPGDLLLQQPGVLGEGRGLLVGGEIDREAAADVDGVDLLPPGRGVDLLGEFVHRPDALGHQGQRHALGAGVGVQPGQPGAVEIGAYDPGRGLPRRAARHRTSRSAVAVDSAPMAPPPTCGLTRRPSGERLAGAQRRGRRCARAPADCRR